MTEEKTINGVEDTFAVVEITDEAEGGGMIWLASDFLACLIAPSFSLVLKCGVSIAIGR